MEYLQTTFHSVCCSIYVFLFLLIYVLMCELGGVCIIERKLKRGLSLITALTTNVLLLPVVFVNSIVSIYFIKAEQVF